MRETAVEAAQKWLDELKLDLIAGPGLCGYIPWSMSRVPLPNGSPSADFSGLHPDIRIITPEEAIELGWIEIIPEGLQMPLGRVIPIQWDIDAVRFASMHALMTLGVDRLMKVAQDVDVSLKKHVALLFLCGLLHLTPWALHHRLFWIGA